MVTKSLRDALLIPIIVGILVALFSFALPHIFSSRKEISYSIDGPTSYIGAQTGARVALTVNGVQTPTLFIYRVRLWNSGKSDISNLPVLFSFSPSPGFQLFHIAHSTIPEREFKIEDADAEPQSKRCTYQLVNPGDQDTVTLLTNSDAPLKIFARAEGLRLIEVNQKDVSWVRRWSWLIGAISALVATLSSVASLALKRLADSNVWPFK